MGTVYRARDPVLDRLVALKTVSPQLVGRPETLVRFQREARAAARLQHPNIVTIYELGEAGGSLFIAMELLDGMDLAEAMAPADRLPLEEKLRIVVDVCRSLDFAHKSGVVHRDVKPANVRILRDGAVKLVDFGIARLVDSSVTQTGVVLGTPSYIAPEVLLAGRGDHRADIWAVGVILYELLAGRRAYQAATIATLVYRIVHEPAPVLDTTALGLPAGLAAVVARALAKDPAGRYPDMAEMARAIQRIIGVTSLEPSLSTEARRRACERELAEARRLFASSDLEKALEAARRAQSLDPSRTDVLGLLERIEERLVVTVETAASPPSPLSVPARATGVAPGLQAAAPATEARPPTPVLTELRLRGAAVFRELATFGEPPATQAACLSPDGDVLATSGADGAVRLWDLHSRSRVATLRTPMHFRTGHDALALCVAFSPDGSLMASGHVDGSVHLWDRPSGEEVPVRLRHDALVGTVAFSPDAKLLVSGGMDQNLKLWDLGAARAGEARRELLRQPSGVTALSYAGGDPWLLVTGHANRVLRVLDASSLRLVATLRGPEGAVSLVCPVPGGRRLVVASQDRTLRFFDLASRSQLFTMPGHRKPTTSIAFFPDGSHLATVAQDNAVHLWDLEARSLVAALWGLAEESFAGVALFGAGDHMAVALSDGRIRVWGPAS